MKEEQYVSLESWIRETAEEMGVRYIYDRWNTVNLQLDKGEFPVIVNVLPVSGSLAIGARYRDNPNCMIAFLDKAELDFDGKENEDSVEHCKLMAQEFIARLNKSGHFRPVGGDIPYSVVYDKLDVAVTGVVIEVQLKENVGVCPPQSFTDFSESFDDTFQKKRKAQRFGLWRRH